MYNGQRKLSVLLAEYSGRVLKANSPELKQFERVRCDLGYGKDSCWMVDNYSIISNGYPRFRDEVTGRMTVIQRSVWELCNGVDIPEDKVVIRTCGSGRCVNPDHLLLCDREKLQGFINRMRMFRKRIQEIKEMSVKNPAFREWLMSPEPVEGI